MASIQCCWKALRLKEATPRINASDNMLLCSVFISLIECLCSAGGNTNTGNFARQSICRNSCKKNEYNQDPELKVKKCLKINFIIRTREFVCGDNLINLNPKIFKKKHPVVYGLRRRSFILVHIQLDRVANILFINTFHTY